MSPLSVAQYLDAESTNFDLVVFDEASQIPVWDAVGVIARGKQVIVAGDPKQLPPTSFFGRADSDEDSLDDYDLVEDQESILDECMGAGLPCYHLNWHYRSQNETLIAFSNHHYYENRLFTFPSPDNVSTGVRWVHVPEGHYDKGRTRTNRAEGERVVQEIQNRLHDPKTNSHSIGVVTFSQAQQVLIENLLDDLRMKDPTVEAYFDDDAVEDPIFVKNLENVQGDERDVIIFSIGYGPDASGKPSMNFGPLNRDGGERRLNVAVTRAKREVVLISTLRPEQIDLSRTRSVGVAQLKAYMEYAQRGPKALGEQVINASSEDFDSLFEEKVCRFLESKGYKLHTQVGCSGYRIDLAIVDPDEPGKYLVGIECDGATYHSSSTARDRDRLRQLVLEGLGWKIERVWSTDWWNNRAEAEARLLERVEHAIELSKVNAPEELPIEQQEKVAPQKPSLQKTIQTAMNVDSSKAEIDRKVYPGGEPVLQKNQEQFYAPQHTQLLRDQLIRIVEREGPICESLLLSRVAEEWEFGRVGARIRERVFEVMDLKKTTEPEGDQQVYWPNECNPSAYQVFRVADENKENSFRTLENIPRPEIRNAILSLLQDYGSMPIESLMRETLKLFGLKQLSKKAKSYLSLSVDALTTKLQVNEDTIALKE
ncbi:DUF3320 domain-containing protein [Kiritimatiellaeota bacterium B1221]|nr:DUF3320 domain-containing protein [Kiritimatiellaeota bacterium B1221]